MECVCETYQKINRVQIVVPSLHVWDCVPPRQEYKHIDRYAVRGERNRQISKRSVPVEDMAVAAVGIEPVDAAEKQQSEYRVRKLMSECHEPVDVVPDQSGEFQFPENGNERENEEECRETGEFMTFQPEP